MLSSKIQQKISKEQEHAEQSRNRKVLQGKPVPFRHAGKAQRRDHPDEDRSAGEEAKKEIESGKSFASVAKAKSIDPTSKAKGGLLTGVAKGQEEAALNTAIFSAPLNKLSGPVKTPFGYYIYEVEELDAGHAADAQAGGSVDQAAADRHQPAGGAEQVRQGIQKNLDREDGLPRRIRGDGLQAVQSAEDELHGLDGHRRPADETGSTSTPTTTTTK